MLQCREVGQSQEQALRVSYLDQPHSSVLLGPGQVEFPPIGHGAVTWELKQPEAKGPQKLEEAAQRVASTRSAAAGVSTHTPAFTLPGC